MKKHLKFVCLSFVLTACGNPNSASTVASDQPGNATTTGQVGNPYAGQDLSLNSGVGAQLEAEIYYDRTTDGADGLPNVAQLSLTYFDNHGYFGDAKQLTAVLKIHQHEVNTIPPQPIDEVVSLQVILGQSTNESGQVEPGIWEGGTTLAVPHGTIVDRVELAYTDGEKWDSNSSKNYQAVFNGSQPTQ